MESTDPRPARILVLYHSETGNTRLMAELVAEGARAVADTEVRLRSVDEATEATWSGATGSRPARRPTSARSPGRSRSSSTSWCRFWPEIEGKIGCAFASSGGLQGGGELTCQTILAIIMNFGMLTFGVPDYVAPGRTLHYGAVCAGRPRDDADREACRRVGRRLAEWVHTLMLGRPELSPRLATYDRRV